MTYFKPVSWYLSPPRPYYRVPVLQPTTEEEYKRAQRVLDWHRHKLNVCTANSKVKEFADDIPRHSDIVHDLTRNMNTAKQADLWEWSA